VVPLLVSFLPASGGIGESVSINGTGFSLVAANNIVKFNGVTATVTSVSTTSNPMTLFVTVPAGATTGKLTVQVNGGTELASTTDFQVLPGTWTSKATFAGSARLGAVGFSIGSKGYIGTGRNSSNVPVKEFWEYDPATNTWSQKADFAGTARWNAVGFGIGSKGYLGTGDDGTATASNIRNDFWEYDPATNAWTARANFGGTARTSATGFSIGTKGYIGTGIDNLTTFTRRNDFWEYDPSSNTWTQRATVGTTGRSSAKGFVIGNNGYIVGGELSLSLQDTWEYNPTNNTWTQRANHPTTVGTFVYASSTAVGFSVGTKGYLCAGNTTRICIEYNPATNTWTQVASLLGDARNFAVGFNIGSKAYVGLGGFSSVRFDSFLEFTP
jgi:N-acetylneuraminic acid mutarotase